MTELTANSTPFRYFMLCHKAFVWTASAAGSQLLGCFSYDLHALQ